MLPDFSKTIYLKALTSKGTQIVNLINNSSSPASISNLQITNHQKQINHAVKFDYQQLTFDGNPNGPSKSITRNFNFKILLVQEIIYGQRIIWVTLHLPKNQLATINLVNNSGSPAQIDYLNLIGNQQIDFLYHDLKANQRRTISKKLPTDLKALGIKDLHAIAGDRFPKASLASPADLKPTLLSLIDLLTKSKLTYWVHGNTLLGAVRHHGLSETLNPPYLTLAFLMEDIPKLYQLLADSYRYFLMDVNGLLTSARAPYGIMSLIDFEYPGGPKIIIEIYYYKKSPTMPPFWKSKAGLELLNQQSSPPASYFWCHAGDKSSVWAHQQGGIYNLPEPLLFPLKEEWFYNRRVKIPNQTQQVLQLWYGPKSLTHQSKIDQEGKTQIIPIQDFSPL